MNKLALAAIPLVALAGCGSTTATSQGAAAPSPTATAACTTRACIVGDAEGLKGTVAKDNSVMTKVTCKPSTVKQVVSGTYTVHCAITYSDGSVWDGIASVLLSQGNVAWEPTSMVSEGNGGN